MKRLPLIVLAGLFSCFSTGCITGLTCGLAELSSGRPCSVLPIGLVTVPLDVITSPLQLPFWIDYGFSNYCLDYFYPYGWWEDRRNDCISALEKDFDEVLRNPRYFQKYDEHGKRTPEFAALREFFQRYYVTHLYKLTKTQAEYVAVQTLEHPEIFQDVLNIWHSKVIAPELRMKALAVLQRQGDRIEQHYEELLNFPDMTDAMLLKIVESHYYDRESWAALRILEDRRKEEKEKRKREEWKRKEQIEREEDENRFAAWCISTKQDQDELQKAMSRFERPGVRSRIVRSLKNDGCFPETNAIMVVEYELNHIKSDLHEIDCLIPALQNRWITFDTLRKIRPQVVAVAQRLKNRKAARELIRAFCGNFGQRYMEPVVCYVDPRLAWLREEMLRNECPEMHPSRRVEMCKELDAIHSKFATRRNSDEELVRIDEVLKKYQPETVPPSWLAKLAHAGDTNRIEKTSRYAGRKVADCLPLHVYREVRIKVGE